MTGVVVLEGGGAFEANDDLDRRMLTERGIERVVMLPTADAYERPAVLVDSALAWGARIGVAVEPVMVLTRDQAGAEAAEAVAAVPAVVLAGDSASHLRSVLKDTPLFDAIRGVLLNGGTVMACGPCAAALCDPMTDQRGGGFALGLGLVAGVAVIPGSDQWPHDQLERTHALADTPVVDLPIGAALIRDGDMWSTEGAVTVHGELPRLS